MRPWRTAARAWARWRQTPRLAAALARGDAAAARGALERGADPRPLVPSPGSPEPVPVAVQAVDLGDLALLEAAAAAGADLDAVGPGMFALPALAEALSRRRWSLATWLVQAGARWDVEFYVLDARTPPSVSGALDPKSIRAIRATVETLVSGEVASLRWEVETMDLSPRPGQWHQQPQVQALAALRRRVMLGAALPGATLAAPRARL